MEAALVLRRMLSGFLGGGSRELGQSGRRAQGSPNLFEVFFAARGSGCAIYSVVLTDEIGFPGFLEALEQQPAIHWPTAIVVCRNKAAGNPEGATEGPALKSSRALRGVPVMLCSSFDCGGMALRDAIKMVVRLSDGYSEPRVSRVDSRPPAPDRASAEAASSGSGSHPYTLSPNHIPIKHRKRRSSREKHRTAGSEASDLAPTASSSFCPTLSDKVVLGAPLPVSPAPLEVTKTRFADESGPWQADDSALPSSNHPGAALSEGSVSASMSASSRQPHAPASPRTIPLPSRLTKSASWESDSSKSTTTSMLEAPLPDRLPKPIALSF
eukprot:CAMPEP_0206611856 /NCGR_PEP_ID=MMETSP0325_2-20121206/55573_1 /ASSEMBLY_ACC=CAM_ASM_000347 /TAXON_ID=2866 /ORGANISM="Crypthecodinium cohnii, Strain Seligo" /LENGTH=326 /DNA_ID=CAMNT_0054131297 /DNA_START=51 /DNA_END=1031 /DNA_ORIENTATION=-